MIDIITTIWLNVTNRISDKAMMDGRTPSKKDERMSTEDGVNRCSYLSELQSGAGMVKMMES
ncbi:hypothetical protein GCM10023310_05470 [Paenibacillus vulneris]|uniref:Uncharacterized protein n=1 Tax=Paenibacillus vulneris TaxID=1133364 RepID=A0ABW3UPD3_9BACL